MRPQPFGVPDRTTVPPRTGAAWLLPSRTCCSDQPLPRRPPVSTRRRAPPRFDPRRRRRSPDRRPGRARHRDIRLRQADPWRRRESVRRSHAAERPAGRKPRDRRAARSVQPDRRDAGRRRVENRAPHGVRSADTSGADRLAVRQSDFERQSNSGHQPDRPSARPDRDELVGNAPPMFRTSSPNCVSSR